MARHHAARTPPRGRPANLTRAIAAGLVTAVLAAGLIGCGDPGPSSCAAPGSAPTTLSETDRRDPQVATDGGARAVAVWASATGGPVEAAWRDEAGGWGSPTRLSADAASQPALVMSIDGVAFAVWRRSPVGAPSRVEVSRGVAGRWDAPALLSDPAFAAQAPQIGIDGAGRATVIWRERRPGGDVLVGRTIDADGVAGPAGDLAGSRDVAGRPRIAVAIDGTAAAVWRTARGAVAATVAAPGGPFGAPTVLASGAGDGSEPAIAAGRDGQVVAAWRGAPGSTGAVVAATFANGWDPPTVVDDSGAPPREIPRPGRAATGVQVALLHDGTPAVAWSADHAGTAHVSVAVGKDGGWAAPMRVSRADVAGGVRLVDGPAGRFLAGWEEIDGGLLRVRLAHVGTDGLHPCRDLDVDTTQSGGVTIAGGAAPVVVYLDLRRSRVQAVRP